MRAFGARAGRLRFARRREMRPSAAGFGRLRRRVAPSGRAWRLSARALAGSLRSPVGGRLRGGLGRLLLPATGRSCGFPAPPAEVPNRTTSAFSGTL